MTRQRSRGESIILLICLVWTVMAVVRVLVGDMPTWLTVAAAFTVGWTLSEMIKFAKVDS